MIEQKMARRVFISFAYEDREQVSGFILMSKNPNIELEFVGRHLLAPVESEDPNYIKRRIAELMDGTSVLVCLLGQTTARSDWVDYEIRKALSDGKGVVGIKLKGQNGAPIPPALEEADVEVIDWDPSRLAQAIERAALIAGRPPLGPSTTTGSRNLGGGCRRETVARAAPR